MYRMEHIFSFKSLSGMDMFILSFEVMAFKSDGTFRKEIMHIKN